MLLPVVVIIVVTAISTSRSSLLSHWIGHSIFQKFLHEVLIFEVFERFGSAAMGMNRVVILDSGVAFFSLLPARRDIRSTVDTYSTTFACLRLVEYIAFSTRDTRPLRQAGRLRKKWAGNVKNVGSVLPVVLQY
jgi:hypothetical protein